MPRLTSPDGVVVTTSDAVAKNLPKGWESAEDQPKKAPAKKAASKSSDK